MATAFPRVLRHPIEPTNTLLVGSGRDFGAAHLRRNLDALPRPLRAPARTAAMDLTSRLPGGEVYTDDRAPVEWLVDSSLLEYANDE
jgi:hypothetical protein